jgi:hypothetical protein
MQVLARTAVIGLGLIAGGAADAQAQYYNYYYYGSPNSYSWSPYNYPGALSLCVRGHKML